LLLGGYKSNLASIIFTDIIILTSSLEVKTKMTKFRCLLSSKCTETRLAVGTRPDSSLQRFHRRRPRL